jgi:uncharacterized membrane protein (DUF485 family)
MYNMLAQEAVGWTRKQVMIEASFVRIRTVYCLQFYIHYILLLLGFLCLLLGTRTSELNSHSGSNISINITYVFISFFWEKI